MPFSKGQIIFAIAFVITFAIVMVWAYLSDRNTTRVYYKKVYLILIAVIAILGLYKLASHYLHQ
jgi:uncharacterized membrane protein